MARSRASGAFLRSSPRDSSLWLALIVFAAVAAYWNSLTGPFVWDDRTAIVTNQTIHDLWNAWSPPRETPVAGRPVVNFSFALNYAAGGLNVTGYHIVNIAVHLGCALLLFGIVRRTLDERTGVRQNADAAADMVPPDAIALVAALLWLLHPIQSEAVDYLTQRTESMMALFFFLTLYCAIRARRTLARGSRWEASAIVACALGMASKETMVTAPVVVLLYDRAFEFDSFRNALRARIRLHAGLAATWLVLGTLMWRAARSTVSLTTVSPWMYLLNQAQLIAQYLRLMVWPRALVLDYGLPRTLTLGDAAPQAMLIAALVAAAIVAYMRWPKIGFLPVTFFLTLAPSSSIVPVVTEVGAERRMYVPSAALAVLAVVIGCWLLQRLTERHLTRPRPLVAAATGLTIVAIAALGVRTVYRNEEYASPLTLWRTVVDRHPHGRARFSLATELVAAGRHDEAMSELHQAVRDFPDARYALGTELAAIGHLDEAARELQEFIRPQPSRPDRMLARLLLGNVFIAQGKLDEAARQFQSLLDGNASDKGAQEGLTAVGVAHRDLAGAMMRQKNAGQAEAHAREAVRLLPQDSAARNLLGVALASEGRLDEAVAQFQQALQISPDDRQARDNLTHALSLVQPRRP